jgi:hypothetical protein
MADLFLHLAFARRLRLAEELHPLVGETLARRPALVALGAALPHMPGVERKGMGFFLRLFSRGSEAARWQKQLAPTSSPRPELVKRFLLPTNDLGPMARLSVALGMLAHEILEASTSSLAPANAAERAGIERAQARLWLQAAVPNARDLENEWRPVADLADADLQKRAIEHVDGALRAAFGQAPGRDAIARWMKGLVAEVAPAALQGLPPSLGVADHIARGPNFENNNFVARVQDAVNWFVVAADRLGARAESTELDAAAIVEALCAGGTTIVQEDAGSAERRERWMAWQRERRDATLNRGRNERPAFSEGHGDVRHAHRSNAFTGMLNLSDLPPGELPPELKSTSLPPESSAAAPPLPAMTQEVSLAAIAAAAANAAHSAGFAAPTMTQEISLAQIEAESGAFAAPAATQEISLAQIEAAASAEGSPASPNGLTEQIQQLHALRTAGAVNEPESDAPNARVDEPSLVPEPPRE